MNSDGHLTINGNGDINNGDEADASSTTDNVVAATGNYKVRIDNATGAGSVADYKGNELIYVNDINTDATFSAANKADWVLTPIRLSRKATLSCWNRWN